MGQPGKVANPARGQMNRENEYSPVDTLESEPYDIFQGDCYETVTPPKTRCRENRVKPHGSHNEEIHSGTESRGFSREHLSVRV